MTSRLKKRRDDPAPRLPPPKRRRDTSSESSSSDPESSESELSDVHEELEEETMNTLMSGATQGRPLVEDDDDDDDESDDESDEDTPEEREEEYVYEDDKDISDPDLSPAPKKLPLKPPPRASARRKSSSRTKTGPSNLSSVSRPNDTPMKDSITISRRAAAAAAAAKKVPPRPEQTIKLTLKMTKDKLREATAAWTPPPGATEPGIDESSSAEDALPARTGRGRKIVEDEESDDDEDADGEAEDEDAEGEDDDGLNDEDAEGETDDEEILESEDDDETRVDSPDFRSRTGTPDMSRLTKRQKSRLDEVYSADLLELPTGIERPGAAKAIPLTADEQALKRAEMARRRKNLTDQRLEEEKIDTINKLLKKQTPKMRNKGQNTGVATPADLEPGAVESLPAPKMVRWISTKDGIRVGVPDAWLAGPVGRVFLPQRETQRMKAASGRMVEEVVPMEIDV